MNRKETTKHTKRHKFSPRKPKPVREPNNLFLKKLFSSKRLQSDIHKSNLVKLTKKSNKDKPCTISKKLRKIVA